MPRKKKLKVTVSDLRNTKQGKYLVNKAKGLSKKDSAIEAGYSESTATHAVQQIEKSEVYQELERKFFVDTLKEQTSLEEIGEELLKNVRQDKDRGAKNKAIEIVLNKLEPEQKDSSEDERVFVVIN